MKKHIYFLTSLSLAALFSFACFQAFAQKSVGADTVGYCLARYSTQPATGCDITFINTSKTNMGVGQYLWDFGDATSTSATASPLHTYSASGTYYACLTMKVGTGCKDTACSTVAVTCVTGVFENANNAGSIENFPNPFSGSTTINYSIFESGNLEINVYNIVGEKVQVLAREKKSSGSYKMEWNAGGLPGGMYFLELKMNNALVVKKLNIAR